MRLPVKSGQSLVQEGTFCLPYSSQFQFPNIAATASLPTAHRNDEPWLLLKPTVSTRILAAARQRSVGVEQGPKVRRIVYVQDHTQNSQTQSMRCFAGYFEEEKQSPRVEFKLSGTLRMRRAPE